VWRIARPAVSKSELSSRAQRGIQVFAGNDDNGGAGKDLDPSLRSG